MIHLAQDRGWSFTDEAKHDVPLLVAAPSGREKLAPAGVEFTERMAGYISAAVTLPHETAARRGKEAGLADELHRDGARRRRRPLHRTTRSIAAASSARSTARDCRRTRSKSSMASST